MFNLESLYCILLNKIKSNQINMKTHIDICHTTHVTCPALAHFFNTLLTLAICEFPLVSVYDSDSSNHVLSKNIF